MSDKSRIDEPTGTATVGHEWDGIEELNTPLPRWWLWTFYATILFAIALLFAGFAPAHQAMMAPGEHVAANAGMPCETMMGHVSAMMGDEMPDDGQVKFDLCCGGALCAADTVRDSQEIALVFAQALAFTQLPPDALHVSDITLPERPPRRL